MYYDMKNVDEQDCIQLDNKLRRLREKQVEVYNECTDFLKQYNANNLYKFLEQEFTSNRLEPFISNLLYIIRKSMK